jgi:Mg/Co/Ni transporter MgtE
LALKHDINTVPIVDDTGVFLGVVPSDRILDILYQEHKEAAYKSVGIITRHTNPFDNSL